MLLKPESKNMELLSRMNRSKKVLASLVILGMLAVLSGCSGKDEKAARDKNVDPKVQKLKLLPEFYADHLYSPGENEQGSWVAMAFDDKGRMIACDQYGYLYRLTIPPVGSDTTIKTKVEKLDIHIEGDTASLKLGYAHGLLYAFNSLYVMVNDE